MGLSAVQTTVATERSKIIWFATEAATNLFIDCFTLCKGLVQQESCCINVWSLWIRNQEVRSRSLHLSNTVVSRVPRRSQFICFWTWCVSQFTVLVFITPYKEVVSGRKSELQLLKRKISSSSWFELTVLSWWCNFIFLVHFRHLSLHTVQLTC